MPSTVLHYEIVLAELFSQRAFCPMGWGVVGPVDELAAEQILPVRLREMHDGQQFLAVMQ